MPTACEKPLNPPQIEARFPPGSAPEGRILPEERCLPTLSAVRSFGYTPLLITGALRQVLLQHFADAENVQNARLRRYLQERGVWTAGAQSGLVIESFAHWAPEKAGDRPAILLKEGDWTYQQMFPGNFAGADPTTGDESSLGMWAGTHTLFVVGVEVAETQILAAETARILVWFSRTIMNQLELHLFRVDKIGAPHTLTESREHYTVPIDVAYAAEERWLVYQEAPRVRTINLAASGEFGTIETP